MVNIQEYNKVINTNSLKKGDLLIEYIDENTMILLIVIKIIDNNMIEVKYSCYNYQDDTMFYRPQTISIKDKQLYKFSLNPDSKK